jgi:hypothetical protein
MYSLGTLGDGVVVVDLDGASAGDSWNDIIVIYNSSGNFTFWLPTGNDGSNTWHIAA